MQESVFLDEIVSIEELGKQETIDISVSGNNLFFANDILTHNSGYDNSDLGMTDVSESFGMSHTADLILALMTSKEMEKLNQIKVKQIKNRYNDVNYHNVFVIGIDRPKMRLFDCESHASKELVENRDEKVVESVFLDLTAKKKPSNYSNLKL